MLLPGSGIPAHDLVAALARTSSGDVRNALASLLESHAGACFGLAAITRLPLVLILDSCLVRQKDPSGSLCLLLL